MKKTLIILIIIAIIFIAIDFFYLKKILFKKNENLNLNDENNSTKNLIQTPFFNQNANYPLKINSIGQNVKYLQAAINVYKGENLTLDGYFGNKTKEALEKHYNISAVPEQEYKLFVIPYIDDVIRYYELKGVVL